MVCDPTDRKRQNRQIHRQKQTGGCQGLEEGMGSPFAGVKMYWNQTEVMVEHTECAKRHGVVHFKMAKMARCGCSHL
jgi:hypothetical protein